LNHRVKHTVLIMLMVTGHMIADPQMCEEFFRFPRILGQNAIGLRQHANRSKRDIFQVANGRWNYNKFQDRPIKCGGE